ncbi:NADH-quinone oxidoreductase subunit J [Desmospora profundinema]|nr:NADH-quinone oxidoreductase subunit J [Desmospora profundinema]
MAIGGAVFMINLTRVVHMALALAFTFLSIAGIYVTLHAEFLAVVQVLIYTGAVTILMLFGIMLTRHQGREEEGSLWKEGLSFVGVGALFGLLMWAIYQTPFSGETGPVELYTVAHLGEAVFKHYVIPFEVTSVLLLVALVGAIILAKKESKS